MALGIIGVGKLNCALHILANEKRTLGSIAIPPLYESLIVGSCMAYLPVELRHGVVNPSVVHPQEHVGVEVFIVLCATCVAAYLHSRTLVAVDAKRRYAELHPWLNLMDALATFLDEHIDIVATPVTTIAYAIAVFLKLAVVGNLHSCNWIGIEIVVHVYAVDIITRHNVVDHLNNIVAILGKSGVENEKSVIREYTARAAHGDMIGCKSRRELGLSTIWVEPCMKLHATTMTLIDHPLQRVPIGRWCLTLLSCEETTPGLYVAFIESVALGTHLKEDGIDTILL